MKQKIILIISVVLIILSIIIGIIYLKNNENYGKKENISKNIQIVVYDESEKVIYDEKKETEKSILLDVLKSLEDLDIETETGDYGEYIISINDKKQENNYYWNYYINGKYAPVGVSSYKIKENDVYTFKLEKFE